MNLSAHSMISEYDILFLIIAMFCLLISLTLSIIWGLLNEPSIFIKTGSVISTLAGAALLWIIIPMDLTGDHWFVNPFIFLVACAFWVWYWWHVGDQINTN